MIEIESSRPKIRRLFRRGIRPGQGRRIMGQIVPDKLAKISEANARGKRAFTLDFVTHRFSQLDELRFVRGANGAAGFAKSRE